MEIKIQIYNKFDAELEKVWTEIQKKSEITIFQSYAWINELFKVFSEKNPEPIIVCVLKENIPKAIIPLEIKKTNFSQYLCWLFQDKIDFTFPIIKKNFFLDEKIINYIFNFVLKKYSQIDAIFLDRQLHKINNYENPYVNFLENIFHSNNYKIKLPVTNKEYEKHVLKKQFLIQNNRKKKQLKKIGFFKFKSAKNKYEKIKLLDILLKNKKISYFTFKKKVFDSNDKFFFENLIYNENFNIHLSYLRLKNDFLSIHFGIFFRDTYNYFIISNINLSYDRFSPGRLLVHFLIRFCIKKKITFFDFLLGEENYKKNWCNETDKIYYYIKIINFKGWMNLNILKRILKRFLMKNC